MKDVERVLGALEEFKETTKDRLEKIEHKVDSIVHLKWKIAGGATVASFVLTTAIEWLIKR